MFRVLWVGGEHQNSILLPILKYLNGRAGLEHMSDGLFQVFPEHSENVLLILLVIQDLSLTLPKDQAMLNFPITDFDP